MGVVLSVEMDSKHMKSIERIIQLKLEKRYYRIKKALGLLIFSDKKMAEKTTQLETSIISYRREV